VKLHRCGNEWVKVKGHPCWKVEKALKDMGSSTRSFRACGPGRKRRTAVIRGTGRPLYPAIQLDDGTWYREQSADMEKTIRAGKLPEKSG